MAEQCEDQACALLSAGVIEIQSLIIWMVNGKNTQLDVIIIHLKKTDAITFTFSAQFTTSA